MNEGGSTPVAEADLEAWADLANLVHGAIVASGGDCPDNGSLDAGVCHDVADAVLAAGYRRPVAGSTEA